MLVSVKEHKLVVVGPRKVGKTGKSDVNLSFDSLFVDVTMHLN